MEISQPSHSSNSYLGIAEVSSTLVVHVAMKVSFLACDFQVSELYNPNKASSQ